MVRIWDKTLHKFTYVEYIEPSELEEISERYVVMKSTGQKDKNGTDLYIGDMLQQAMNVSFHEIYRYTTLTHSDCLLDEEEVWEKIGDIYTMNSV